MSKKAQAEEALKRNVELAEKANKEAEALRVAREQDKAKRKAKREKRQGMRR